MVKKDEKKMSKKEVGLNIKHQRKSKKEKKPGCKKKLQQKNNKIKNQKRRALLINNEFGFFKLGEEFTEKS